MSKLILNLTAASGLLLSVPVVFSTDLNLATQPLYSAASATPMMMLVMGRDHTLYYEAYNDAADLDGKNDSRGDGVLDIKFKPGISYEGYFDPAKCYSYASNLFTPTRVSATCTVAGEWSGNFLNYLTMTRMDILRKVLYGGYRSTDSADETILERAFIPQDAHSWAKSYDSAMTIDDDDYYDIADYTPYIKPESGKQHFFGSVTYTGYGSAPILRVRENVSYSGDWGPWSWASTERPVLNAGGTDFTVRVKVCVAPLMEANCKAYEDGTTTPITTTYKPTGLLQDYGDNDQMLFGLLTGSYDKNLSGGVLRKAISNFSEEVNDNGTYDTTVNGIVSTINKLRVHGFRYTDQSYQTNCGWVTNGPIIDGQCASWGNPIGEMLYESLRYFSGIQSPSTAYNSSTKTYDQDLDLPSAEWDDPFAGSNIKSCSRATNLVISDINPSYDSDQLPGANFGSYSDTTFTSPAFNLSTLLNTISVGEDKTSGNYFIGQSGTNTDNAPTAKAITGLGNTRGLAPAEPTKQGSYSSAGVAYYGKINDISTTQDGDQNVNTMVVAMASALPEVTVNVDGHEIKIVPFAKSVGQDDDSFANFQPTNTIVDWYVEEISDTRGVFRINFEDVEQGADHDMDMVVKYTYEVKMLCPVSGVTTCATKQKGVEITLDSTYAAGGIDQHAGYIISGTTSNTPNKTTDDGLYLEVKDQGGANRQYYLDTPDSSDYQNRGASGSNADLPFTTTRNFFPGSTAANFLPSPLYYAAKWGGFTDSDDGSNNVDGKPNIPAEWDKNGDDLPDTYFPVTNAGELKSQLSNAFYAAFSGNSIATAPVYSSKFLQQGTLQYRAIFKAEKWTGDVMAFAADSNGEFSDNFIDPLADAQWSAAAKLDARTPESRKIFSRRSAKRAIFEFTLPASITADTNSYTQAQLNQLLENYPGASTDSDAEKLSYLQAVVNYIRGDRTHEVTATAYSMRERESRLGDIIHSTPYFVGASNGHAVAKELLVFGANDGMVHIIDATDGVDGGKELMAYIPSGIYGKLKDLVKPTYTHQYSVDGGITAYTDENDKTILVGTLGLGGKGLYAIDVSNMTTPATSMIKWEIMPSRNDGTNASPIKNYSNLGFTTAAPTIVKLANGTTGVIFANGYNATSSVSGEATIYIVDLDDGSLIKTLTTGTLADPTGNSRPNAMASPAVIDINADKVADYIYAGDLYGNMWVFDIRSPSPSNWGNKKTDDKPLFTTSSPTRNAANTDYLPQPITTQPVVGVHPYGLQSGVLVAFGTGQYIETTDNVPTDQATQSFYIIRDTFGTAVIDSSRDITNGNKHNNLLAQEIVREDANKRELSTHAVDWATHSGIYLDLINTGSGNTNNFGERQVTDSVLFGNKVIFTSLLPNPDPCTVGGSSWYMELNLHTGQSWKQGTAAIDDPTTAEDESQTIPVDTSNSKLDAIGTTSTVTVNTIKNQSDSSRNLSDGTSENDLGDETPIGRLSWRQLY